RRGPPHIDARTAASAGPVGSTVLAATRGAPNATGSPAAEEVEIRLTHVLDGARVEVPALARAETLLAAHWRRMQIPWIPMSPLSRRVSTSIALRTSAEEKQ